MELKIKKDTTINLWGLYIDGTRIDWYPTEEIAEIVGIALVKFNKLKIIGIVGNNNQ